MVTEIYGTLVSSPSSTRSTKVLIKANHRPKYSIKFRFPNGVIKSINYLRYNKTDYFFLDGDTLGENYLKQLPECDD